MASSDAQPMAGMPEFSGGAPASRWAAPIASSPADRKPEPGAAPDGVNASTTPEDTASKPTATKKTKRRHIIKLAPKSAPAELTAEQLVERAPPWLLSAVAHMALILLLALLWVADRRAPRVELTAEIFDSQGQQLEDTSALDSEGDDAEQSITLEAGPTVEDPFATPPEVAVSLLGAAPVTPLTSTQIGLALSGRDEGQKQRLLAAFGGNGQSEQAVALGLKWLARQQRPDGSWSLLGPYADAAGSENATAATAMALLAFQGAGHTHLSGSYKSNVSKGLDFLLTQQDPEGNFFQQGKQSEWFYTQGQATIAICELYAMTRDSNLRERAQRAIDFCVLAQDALGGWRYSPGGGSDVSVTGWVLMALQSARMAGLTVPPETLSRIGEFLDLASHEGGTRYSYQPRQAPTETMTAEALLCRQYLGWPSDDPRLLAGADFLTQKQNLPNWKERNVYYWYYASQVLHHLGGPRWDEWNSVMRDLMVAHQEKAGKAAGSWSPLTPEPDKWGYHGGRLYVTCLSLYVLEVYYRHLPLYAGASSP